LLPALPVTGGARTTSTAAAVEAAEVAMPPAPRPTATAGAPRLRRAHIDRWDTRPLAGPRRLGARSWATAGRSVMVPSKPAEPCTRRVEHMPRAAVRMPRAAVRKLQAAVRKPPAGPLSPPTAPRREPSRRQPRRVPVRRGSRRATTSHRGDRHRAPLASALAPRRSSEALSRRARGIWQVARVLFSTGYPWGGESGIPEFEETSCSPLVAGIDADRGPRLHATC
jgi:hypothetical protein